MIHILSSPESPVLMPIGKLMCESLVDNGYEAKEQNLCRVNEVEYEKGDIVIIIGAGRFLNIAQEKQKGVKYVLWNSEPIPTTPTEIAQTKIYNERFENFKKLLPYYDYYFDYWQRQCEYMNRIGFKCDGWCEIGYHRNLDYTKEYPEDFKYDIIFVGKLRGRRKDVYKEITSKVEKYHSTYIWGEKKYQGFSECKVALNIHYELLDSFEQWRIMEMLCNKKLVISELINGPISLINNEHFIEVTRENFVEKVVEVVENYSKYQYIAKQGYDFIKNSCKFNDNTKKMIEYIMDQERR